ncbi:MAG: flavin reductase family protein [Caldilineaceae bacterium]
MTERKEIVAALQQIPYGLYILTTGRGSNANAITCNWVSQVSFEPLLVMVAVEKQSRSHQLLEAEGIFVINVLAKEQAQLARRMAAPHRLNPHKVARVEHRPGVTGAPVLTEAMAFLECNVHHALEAGGDHTLFVGEVIAGALLQAGEPLTLRAAGLHYNR